MRQVRDPAPSRLSYRLTRLMLTPRFRAFLRFGLPLIAMGLAISIWASDDMRRDQFAERASEIRRQIEERPEFLVRMMVIEGASPDVAAMLRRNLPVDLPVSSFDLELDTVREAVEAHDPVASASVRIKGGGVLEVTVEERVAMVVFRGADGLALLDGEGHRVAELDDRSARPDLPLLVGRGAERHVTEALGILEAAGAVAPRVRGLRRVGERRWDLVLDRDQVVMLPEDAPRLAVERVMALDAAQDLLARDIEVIDFRNPARPILRLNDTAMDALLETGTSRIYGVDME